MTTTRGRPTSQASAICAGLAWCAVATSRSRSSSGATRRRFSVPNSGLTARTPPGRCSASYRPPSSPWASGL